MIPVTQLKSGVAFLFEGKPYRVLKYTHQKIGRGGAHVKVSLRNLASGDLVERTLNSSWKVEELGTSKKKLQFLYSDNDTAIFMDPITFDQVEIPQKLVSDELEFIKEGEAVDVLFIGEEPISVELPAIVTMTVSDTPPGVKGNSATNVFKVAATENGLSVKVPLFIKKGDKIKVDTKKGAYLERAK